MSKNLTLLESYLDGGLYELIDIEEDDAGRSMAVLRTVECEGGDPNERTYLELLDDDDRAFARAAIDAPGRCDSSPAE